jgi:hypothetical protein
MAIGASQEHAALRSHWVKTVFVAKKTFAKYRLRQILKIRHSPYLAARRIAAQILRSQILRGKNQPAESF